MLSLSLAILMSTQDPAPPKKFDERLYALARTNLGEFAQEVTKGKDSELGKVQSIVRWVADNFDWKYTDYEKRTVQQVIERRGGNCDDMARVVLATVKELGIKTRRIHEVHIRTISERRGRDAKKYVKERGKEYSVFGTHHNDHVYVEVWDSKAGEWFPADPWSALAGDDEWMAARIGFGERGGPNPDAKDMIVPIAIFAEDDSKHFTINRTKHYLVDGFDRLCGGKLHSLPSWKKWTTLIDDLDDKVGGAFAGRVDLHQDEVKIDQVAETYEKLRAEYLAVGKG
jgi:hypothetical protein